MTAFIQSIEQEKNVFMQVVAMPGGRERANKWKGSEQ